MNDFTDNLQGKVDDVRDWTEDKADDAKNWAQDRRADAREEKGRIEGRMEQAEDDDLEDIEDGERYPHP